MGKNPDGITELEKLPTDFKIGGFGTIYKSVQETGVTTMLTFNGDENEARSRAGHAGDIRVDVRQIDRSNSYSESSFFGQSMLSRVSSITEKVPVETPKPEEFSDAALFKSGFVHQITDDMPFGGGTLATYDGNDSTPDLDTDFAAPEDGKIFHQADIDHMVEMAIETEGFELALDFNADEDGSSAVYDDTYLNANNGLVRARLEAALEGTGIKFEGRLANDVLSDYRGHIVTNLIEDSAKRYFADKVAPEELDNAVSKFMETKFFGNSERESLGSSRANEETHNQAERAVNILFQEIPKERRTEEVVKDYHVERGHSHKDNHTHMAFVSDDLKSGGSYRAKLGGAHNFVDEGTLIVLDVSEQRLKNINKLDDGETNSRPLQINIAGRVSNLTIDNQSFLIKAPGELSVEYVASDRSAGIKEHLAVMIDGKHYANINWPVDRFTARTDRYEDIDPSRIKIGKVDDNGNVSYVGISNQSEYALDFAERSAAGGITPVVQTMEELANLTVAIKNMHINNVDLGNPQEWSDIAEQYQLEEHINRIVDKLSDQLGIEDMEGYKIRLMAQYVNPEIGGFEPDVVMHLNTVGLDIAANYPQLDVVAGNNHDINSELSDIYLAREKEGLVTPTEYTQTADIGTVPGMKPPGG